LLVDNYVVARKFKMCPNQVNPYENRCNYSTINMVFIGLVTWPGVKRVMKKGYKGPKIILWFYI